MRLLDRYVIRGLCLLYRRLSLDLAHFRRERQHFDFYRRTFRGSPHHPVLRHAGAAGFRDPSAGLAVARAPFFTGPNVARE